MWPVKMKRINNGLAATVDGKNDKQDIANLFGEKYKELYNSIGHDEESLGKLNADIANGITSN